MASPLDTSKTDHKGTSDEATSEYHKPLQRLLQDLIEPPSSLPLHPSSTSPSTTHHFLTTPTMCTPTTTSFPALSMAPEPALPP
jgi:hypothetical protein